MSSTVPRPALPGAAPATGVPTIGVLGRTWRDSPQFISIRDGSWLGTKACMERTTAMSSATPARRPIPALPISLGVVALSVVLVFFATYQLINWQTTRRHQVQS